MAPSRLRTTPPAGLPATVAAALVALSVVLALVGPVAPAGAGAPRTYYFTMFGVGEEHPRQIFLTANAGPYLTRLRWSGWGKDATVARGVYRSDCASCPPPRRRQATVRFSHPVVCDDGARTYARGVVTLSRPDRGRHRRTFRIPMGCPPA